MTAYKVVCETLPTQAARVSIHDCWRKAWQDAGQTPPPVFVVGPGIDIQPLDPDDIDAIREVAADMLKNGTFVPPSQIKFREWT